MLGSCKYGRVGCWEAVEIIVYERYKFISACNHHLEMSSFVLFLICFWHHCYRILFLLRTENFIAQSLYLAQSKFRAGEMLS